MAVTLKDISQRAGVSLSAVSQILNHRANDYSSPATKQKVQEIARELGYKQKFGHKLLRGDHTKTVAILLAMHRLILEEHNQYLVLSLMRKFEKIGFVTYLHTMEGTSADNLQLVQELISRGTDHFICIGCPENCGEIEQLIKRKNRSIIGYYSQFSQDIRNDSLLALRETIRGFLAAGRSNFRLCLSQNSDMARFLTLKEFFPQLSLEELMQRYVKFLDFEGEIQQIDELTQQGYAKTAEIIAHDPKVQAIYYLNDYFMLGGAQFLHQHHYVLGQDIVLCGSNNIHAVRNHVLPLESWQIDIATIAQLIFDKYAVSEVFQIKVPPKHTLN